jgi:hypothetical protein
MVEYLIALCSAAGGVTLAFIVSDIAIALAYFFIPLAMLWVLRNRREDLPYPGLWLAFVLFIFACGATHVLHAAAFFVHEPLLVPRAILHVVTALVSIATAIALSLVLPQIADLPSPRQQRAALEKAVSVATRDKDALLLELHHQVGNQLAKLGVLVRIELRKNDPASAAALLRIQVLLEDMGEEHRSHSSFDYLNRPQTVRRSAPLGINSVASQGSAGK